MRHRRTKYDYEFIKITFLKMVALFWKKLTKVLNNNFVIAVNVVKLLTLVSTIIPGAINVNSVI